MLEDTDGVLLDPTPPLTGVGAPHQRPLGKLAMLPSLYTDVRSTFVLVLLAFKKVAIQRESKRAGLQEFERSTLLTVAVAQVGH